MYSLTVLEARNPNQFHWADIKGFRRAALPRGALGQNLFLRSLPLLASGACGPPLISAASLISASVVALLLLSIGVCGTIVLSPPLVRIRAMVWRAPQEHPG